MNKSFSIIHLSDVHFDKSKETISSVLVNNIVSDIQNLEKTENLNCKFLVLTGDLINFGGQAELFESAYQKIIQPILNELKIDKNNFIYIPGNHELDRDEVDKDFQYGFINRISREGVEHENFNNSYLTNRSKNFFNFIKTKTVWENHEVIKNIINNNLGVSIGFSLFNTAWCSSTFSEEDVKKIQMPIMLAKENLQELENCDIKIALMHHPLDWFEDENANQFQHILSQYNIVLCGHKHNEDNKLEQKGPLKTVFNYAHKLLPLKDRESGYSIINISNNENKIKVYYREYNDKISKFTVGITNSEQEINRQNYTEYELGQENSDLQNSYKIAASIRKNFNVALDNLFITNTLESNHKTFDELYVDFSLSDYPNYSRVTKEKKKKESVIYKINDIVDLGKNVNVYGMKESGKTVFCYTIAKYYLDNFEKYKKLPIVIDCKSIGLKNVNISKHIGTVIYDLLDENSNITKKQISHLIENNMFVLIFDEIKYLTHKQLKEIEGLDCIKIKVHEYNPLVFGEDDKDYIKHEITNNDTTYYINSYNKNDVRKLINNVAFVECDRKYIENVISYFYTTSLPRTPFIVSLIATICSQNKDVILTNQAKILEQFLENVLEKINPIEQLSRTYDFNIKEDFLSNFAYELYKKNIFSMPKEEFKQFVSKYHTEKGFDVEDSRFDTIFFEKNILVKDDNLVYFRFICFNYYYLAKFATKKTWFRDELLKEDSLLQHSDILLYYTGLKRDDEKLLQAIMNKAKKFVDDNFFEDDIFEKDPIKTNLGFTEKVITNVISTADKIDDECRDKATDRGDNSLDYNPNSNIIKSDNMRTCDKLLSVLGFTIKNSEELNAVLKAEAFDLYIKGCKILWNNFKIELLNFAKEINLTIEEEDPSKVEQMKKNIRNIRRSFKNLYSNCYFAIYYGKCS